MSGPKIYFSGMSHSSDSEDETPPELEPECVKCRRSRIVGEKSTMTEDVEAVVETQPEMITDYRDKRLPCLCVNEWCKDNSPLGYANLLRTHWYCDWRSVLPENSEKAQQCFKLYPKFTKKFYEIHSRVAKEPWPVRIPRTGFSVFRDLLNRDCRTRKIPMVEPSLIEKLWQIAPDEYQERLDRIAFGVQMNYESRTTEEDIFNYRDQFSSEIKRGHTASIMWKYLLEYVNIENVI